MQVERAQQIPQMEARQSWLFRRSPSQTPLNMLARLLNTFRPAAGWQARCAGHRCRRNPAVCKLQVPSRCVTVSMRDPSSVIGQLSRRAALGCLAAGLGAGLVPLPGLHAALPAAAVVSDERSLSPLCDPCVNIVRTAAGQEIVIVGTAHVSEDSANLVRNVIRTVRPDTVMIELDESRVGDLMKAKAKGLKVAVPTEMSTVATPPTPASASGAGERAPMPNIGQVAGQLYRGALEQVGTQAAGTGVKALYSKLGDMGFSGGAEMIAAAQEGKRIGATILLGDRDKDITLRRLGEALAATISSPAPSSSRVPAPQIMYKLPQGFDISREDVNSAMVLLKERENLRQIIAYIKQSAPEFYNALIGERDAYMANSILYSKAKCIVAVVGLAHADGIEAYLLQQGQGTGSRPEVCLQAG